LGEELKNKEVKNEKSLRKLSILVGRRKDLNLQPCSA
jgi:hypothetical protein